MLAQRGLPLDVISGFVPIRPIRNEMLPRIQRGTLATGPAVLFLGFNLIEFLLESAIVRFLSYAQKIRMTMGSSVHSDHSDSRLTEVSN
jgi:hypothetical protein